jgi:hypothetical protein
MTFRRRAPHVRRRPAVGPYRGPRATRIARWGRAEGTRHVLEAEQHAAEVLILAEAQRRLEQNRAELKRRERADDKRRIRRRAWEGPPHDPLLFAETLCATHPVLAAAVTKRRPR